MPFLAGKEITQNGLGLMRFTLSDDVTPDEQAFKVLKAALAAGVNVWNGADFYGTPENNSLHLMNRYFTAYPEDADKVILSIKSGVASMKTFAMDCSPAGLRGFVDNALKILDGKKKIDIFGCARVDPNVPVEESIEALAELKKEGKIGGIQLSEVKAETIRRAASVAKTDMLEAEVSLWAMDVFRNGVAETCAELGIPIIAHTPLGAGMLTGAIKSPDDLPAHDHHRFFPRFQADNLAKNLLLVDELEKIAVAKGCTPAQLALSWVKAQSRKPGMPLFVPVAGARSVSRVIENVKDVDLTDDDLAQIAVLQEKYPVAGERFPPAAMKLNEY
ncbi:aldo/keto reductase [Aspergillus costaricaensis CBS 115574]|uniref:Aldo/keto reductase n=1 Tax=Aspergillus costaricaensis CBS 115574 TaxID=1448317 RepID=A0ACD1II66_9EURO|nr:aldo/keto reductase [Aspergillus costaricaensis CBS 115574]RAK90322.1 aldo/keto reductase [Aspergillus costaricaensis CBS 115574]